MASQERPAAFTIANAISEFLAHEQQRLSLKRLSRYRQVLELFQIYLDGYWPGEPQEEYKRVTELDGTFCTWFGPERVLDGYSEFLGYYMGHKVYNSLETKRAAGTVMARFAEWLAEKGYIASASSIVERSKRASRELPAAETACRILERSLSGAPSSGAARRIEDHFMITRVEPAGIWLSPIGYPGKPIGPIPVPKQATKLLKRGWDIGGTVEETRSGWRFVEIWNVTA